MSTPPTKILLCSCEDTMALDAGAVARGLGVAAGDIATARHLCGPELDTFRRHAAAGGVVVACTAMRALFKEIAEDEHLAGPFAFANVRETAGWSREGAGAAPKMAAILAGARIADEPAAIVSYESAGIALICGRDEAALDLARRLADRLDITVVLAPGADVTPPHTVEYPIRQGRMRIAKGRLGAFAITLDAYAVPRPSSRARLAFGTPRDGAVSNADILIDVTGGAPMFSAPDLREGYLRADPADAAAIERLIARAGDLVGTFDKPRAITFRADLCAHSRSRITGCTRCLDLCPAGAIAPAGDHVAIDPHVCAGCGQCAAACPTGAASYALPPVDRLITRIRAMLMAYRAAGGRDAQMLIHDDRHGADLIDAAARHGDGLPARTIPLVVNEVTQVGIETIAAAFAYGATSVRFLTRANPRHDIAGLHATIATANALLAALGYGTGLVATVEADDPDAMLASLAAAPTSRATLKPGSFQPVGDKRDVMRTALRELHRAAPAPVDVVPLAKGAAFGAIDVRIDGCTLCLSCVAVCPARALSDAADHPRLAFDESLCVQCGLCAATCPEKVITLLPRMNFAAFEAPPVVIKEEEPFCCTTCGKPFGVRSTIERVIARLEDRNWMFADANKGRIALITKCDTCRVEAAVNAAIDPFAGPPRPIPRTTDDYFREREATARETTAREDTTRETAAREAAMRARIDKGET